MATSKASPIHPPLFLAKKYETAVRKAYLDPLYRNLVRTLGGAVAASEVYAVLEKWKAQGIVNPAFTGSTMGIMSASKKLAGLGGLSEAQLLYMLDDQFEAMADWHRSQAIRSFRSALGVDVRRLFADPDGTVRQFMQARMVESVALIKTIPASLHDGLKLHMTKYLKKNPFDQSLLRGVLQDTYKSAGYNLRRLTRDQTNKAIGGLTEIRQTQLGIQRYEWITAGDERVRETHSSNGGQIFRWDQAPETGHPGSEVQCFPGSVRINPAGLKASVTYRYVGEVVEIALADGVDITATPNHPILTESGWKRAGDVNEGDKLLQHVGRGGLAAGGLDPEFCDGYPLAEQLHVLLGGRADEHGSPRRGVDLHGDPALGDVDVDVVAAPRELRDRFDSLSREVFGDLGLESSDVPTAVLAGEGSTVADLVLPPGVADGLVGSAGERASLIGGGPLHADQVRLGTGSGRQSEVVEATVDGGSAEVEGGGDLFHRLLCFPKAPDLGVPAAPAFDVVTADRISTRPHDGLVYSFETATGLIVANGIVTHNCRCTAIAVMPEATKEQIVELAGNPPAELVEQVAATKAAAAAKAKPPILTGPKEKPPLSTPDPPPPASIVDPAPPPPPPPPPAPATQPKAIQVTNADEMMHIKTGEQAGTNPGGFYRGRDGVDRYVKKYDDASQVYGEAVSNNAYRRLGIEAPETSVFKLQGDPWIANKIVPNKGTLAEVGVTKEIADEVLDGFVADVWLKNWDVIGAGVENTYGNIVVTTGGKVARIDQGGSLLFRGLTGRKPPASLNVIDEWEKFFSPTNATYRRMFDEAGISGPGDLNPVWRARLREQAVKLQKLRDETNNFRDLAPTWSSVPAADRNAIITMLQKRADAIDKKVGITRPPKPKKARAPRVAGVAEPEGLPPRPRDLVKQGPNEGPFPTVAELPVETIEQIGWKGKGFRRGRNTTENLGLPEPLPPPKVGRRAKVLPTYRIGSGAEFLQKIVSQVKGGMGTYRELALAEIDHPVLAWFHGRGEAVRLRNKLLSAQSKGTKPRLNAAEKRLLDGQREVAQDWSLAPDQNLYRGIHIRGEGYTHWRRTEPLEPGEIFELKVPTPTSFDVEQAKRFGQWDSHKFRRVEGIPDDQAEVMIRIQGSRGQQGRMAFYEGYEFEQEAQLVSGQHLRLLRRREVIEKIVDPQDASDVRYARRIYVDADLVSDAKVRELKKEAGVARREAVEELVEAGKLTPAEAKRFMSSVGG